MSKKKFNLKIVLHDIFTTIIFLAAAFAISIVVAKIGKNNIDVTLIFILAVTLVSRFTDGYLYGGIASIVAVFSMNYAFTYPYFEFNFSLSGYPMTFITVFAVSAMVSMLTTRTKNHAKIETEIETEKNRANLLRAVSHDIRTPLTSIIGSSSAFLENSDKLSDDAKRELVTDIRDEADWLIKIVENILSITRINNTDTKIEKRPEMVEEIIGETMGKFKKQGSDVHLAISVPATMLFVPMDATLIEQVILNILENSLLHGMNTTEISVTVTNDDKNAIFVIEDNGVGIKKEILPYLFNGYFSPGKESVSDTKRNMGIGLSVCMSIIQAHDGNMRAYNNKKNGGAVFEFSLPLSD